MHPVTHKAILGQPCTTMLQSKHIIHL